MKLTHENNFIILYSIIIAMLAGCMIYAAVVADREQQKREEIESIVITEPALESINDGEYYGECYASAANARVKVTVRSHRITSIEILSELSSHGEIARLVPYEIMAQQKVDVEAISGATYSSVVIKKAVDNALELDAAPTLYHALSR